MGPLQGQTRCVREFLCSELFCRKTRKPGKVVYTCTPRLLEAEVSQDDLEFKPSLGFIVRICTHSHTPQKIKGAERTFLGFNGCFWEEGSSFCVYLGKTGSMKRGEKELQKNLASEPFSSCKVFNMPKSPAWRGGVGLMF